MASVNTILKSMAKKEIRQLSVAVFFLFATIGPLTLLMEPSVLPGPWYRLIILTVTSGLFSAGIVLLINKPVKLILWIVLFVAFQFSYTLIEQYLFTDFEKQQMIVADRLFKLTTEEMDLLQTKRAVFGMIAIVCLATGYALFVRVIGNEKKRRAESEAEMKFAEQIHGSLLPEAPVRTPWCEIAGVSIPAAKIGGDYYDIIQISDSKILLIVADASGHGAGAGVLAAMTKSSIIQELQHTQSIPHVMTNVNKTIYSVTEKNMFVTCALVLLDKHSLSAEIITAGHPQILRHRFNNPNIEEFRTQHFALGIQQDSTYQTDTVQLQKGDTLFIISDGLLDAANPQKEQFGMERLKELILDTERPSADHMSASLIASVREFTITKEFQDDATIVVAKISM
ncbi:MAG: PP2C family protein-serine/threonine phosphatase [Ignavibacteriales bacterium]|nr:PP2C family protein-serine/threonine phosphatase [Ignavibacteriales bacterium]